MYRLRNVLVEDGGFALLAAIGVGAVLAVLAVGGFVMAQNNLSMSSYEKHRVQALAVSEGGLDSVIWRLKTDVDYAPESGSSFTTTITTDSGIAEVTLTHLNDYSVQITSTGHTFRNPSVNRTVVTEVFHMSLWNFVMGADSFVIPNTGGNRLTGNTSVHGPFYVRGDLGMTGTSSIQLGPVFVKDGDVNTQGSASIGADGADIQLYAELDVEGPNIYANVSSNVPDLQLPPLSNVELDAAYDLAIEESLDGLVGITASTNSETYFGDYYKVIDGDTAIGGATETLVIDSSTPSFNYLDGDITNSDFAWDLVNRILYVQGTVFVDGDVIFDTDINYYGNGTIIFTGDAELNGLYLPVGWPESYPEEHVVALATPGSIVFASKTSYNPGDDPNKADMAGAWYAGCQVSIPGNLGLRGSILSNYLEITGNNVTLWTDPKLSANLPPSLPGADDGSTVFMTRWHDAGS